MGLGHLLVVFDYEEDHEHLGLGGTPPYRPCLYEGKPRPGRTDVQLCAHCPLDIISLLWRQVRELRENPSGQVFFSQEGHWTNDAVWVCRVGQHCSLTPKNEAGVGEQWASLGLCSNRVADQLLHHIGIAEWLGVTVLLKGLWFESAETSHQIQILNKYLVMVMESVSFLSLRVHRRRTPCLPRRWR